MHHLCTTYLHAQSVLMHEQSALRRLLPGQHATAAQPDIDPAVDAGGVQLAACFEQRAHVVLGLGEARHVGGLVDVDLVGCRLVEDQRCQFVGQSAVM